MVVGCLLSVLGFIFVKVLRYFINKNINGLSVVGFILYKFFTILLKKTFVGCRLYVRNSFQLTTNNSQLIMQN